MEIPEKLLVSFEIKGFPFTPSSDLSLGQVVFRGTEDRDHREVGVVYSRESSGT